jgi:hypothetical protein
MMPVIACADVLKNMTGFPGIRGRYHFGAAESNAQFAPFDAHRKSDDTVDVKFRTLETFLGNVVQDFVPNDYIMYLLGQGAASLGDGQKTAPSAKLVIACVMKALGKNLREALFTAKRNDAGKTTKDLFDGWLTIVENAITAGEISKEEGNLISIDEAITEANAVDLLKHVERSLAPELRAANKFIYCAPEIADAYNDNYLLTHSGIAYNTEFEQPILEGSMGKTRIIPIDVLAGQKKMIITGKENMIYGYDSMSDVERIQVDRFSSFVLTLSAALFFGTQIRSVDKRVCAIAEFV